MATENRRTFRLSDNEYTELKSQACKLGLNATEYLRLLIALDPSKLIIKQWDIQELSAAEINSIYKKGS